MTDKDEARLETLLQEDDSPSTRHDDATLAKVLQSINTNMATLANSIPNMSEAFAEICHSLFATAKQNSRGGGGGGGKSEPLSSSKNRKASHSKEDSDVVIVIEVDDFPGTAGVRRSEAKPEKSKETDGEDDFLTTLALKYSEDDKTSGPVWAQLADIVNKR